jgi:hypothetical protein
MKLIEVVAMLATSALTFFIYTCLRTRRSQAMSVGRIARSLELAIRAEAARRVAV